MEHDGPETSGAEFARVRERVGLSRRQLAARAGVNVSSVCRVERGGSVKREVRDALVAALGLRARPLIRVRSDYPDTPLYLARRASGVSGREAARRAGVSKDVFARAERGQAIHPRNAHKIAGAFGLDVDDINGYGQRQEDEAA